MFVFVQIWELQTGRCLKTLEVGGVVKSVAWCPNQALSLVAVTVENKVSHSNFMKLNSLQLNEMCCIRGIFT